MFSVYMHATDIGGSDTLVMHVGQISLFKCQMRHLSVMVSLHPMSSYQICDYPARQKISYNVYGSKSGNVGKNVKNTGI